MVAIQIFFDVYPSDPLQEGFQPVNLEKEIGFFL